MKYSGSISIWFFIGVLLAFYGALILGYGLYELITGNLAPVVLAGLRGFLEAGSFKGFTTNFQVLHGMKQLPGLAVQRLMTEGYGFGREGDWKTCALVRVMKVIAADLPGGTSFMEYYTYHLHPDRYLVLGSHMLEVCESIAAGWPSLEIHPLGIGGKEDPVRLVFNAHPGHAVNASLIDLGNRFRLIVNELEAVDPLAPLPKLPVARESPSRSR